MAKKKRREYIHPITGERVRSVTEVMGDNLGWGKEGLIGWANKLGREGKTLAQGRDRSAVMGQCCHALVEHLFTREDEEEAFVDDEGFGVELIATCMPNAVRVHKYLTDEGFTVLLAETQGVHVALNYAGTVDLVLVDSTGRQWIADLKTGNHVHGETIIQLAAYEMLLEDEHNLDVVGGIVVHAPFGSPIKLHEVTRDQLDKGADIFQNLLLIDDFKKEIKNAF